MVTQRLRLQRLQIQGVDLTGIQIASDLLDQMKTSTELMRVKIRALDEGGGAATEALDAPIDDEMVNLDDADSVARWAAQLGITSEALLELSDEVGPSARTLARALGRQQQTNGNPRKSR